MIESPRLLDLMVSTAMDAAAEFFSPIVSLYLKVRQWMRSRSADAPAAGDLYGLSFTDPGRIIRKTASELLRRSLRKRGDIVTCDGSYTISETEDLVENCLIEAETHYLKGKVEVAGRILWELDRLTDQATLRNASYIWFNLGTISFEIQQLPKAEEYFTKVIDLHSDGTKSRLLGATYSNLALIYLVSHNAIKSEEFAREGMELLKTAAGTDSVFESYFQLAYCLAEFGYEGDLNDLLENPFKLSRRMPALIVPTQK